MNYAFDRIMTKKIKDLLWQAIPESWEPGDPIGEGMTEPEAAQDLLNRLQARIDYVAWANPQSHPI